MYFQALQPAVGILWCNNQSAPNFTAQKSWSLFSWHYWTITSHRCAMKKLGCQMNNSIYIFDLTITTVITHKKQHFSHQFHYTLSISLFALTLIMHVWIYDFRPIPPVYSHVISHHSMAHAPPHMQGEWNLWQLNQRQSHKEIKYQILTGLIYPISTQL